MHAIAREPDLDLPPWGRRLVVVFWWFFALATVILMPGGEQPERLRLLSMGLRLLISPIMPLFAWVLLHAVRHPVRRMVARLALHGALRFAIVGSACGLVLALKFAAHGELAGATAWPWGVSVLAYFAVYCGVLFAWLLLRGVWAFSYHHVFWIGGLAFALVEENHAVLRTFATGDTLGGSLLLAYLIPIYGLPFAAPFMLMPPGDLPHASRSPGFAACVACALLPLSLYKYWGIAWHCLLGGPPV
jgi:hypothetical protein